MALFAEFFTHVSPEDLRYRFMSGINKAARISCWR
jgi:hypothetical protein